MRRIVQISALGAGDGTSAYLASKRAADDALLALPIAGTVLQPSLVYGPGSSSARLFATLAGLPMVALPGRGRQPLQPVHVYELAEIIVRCLERREPARGVFQIGGGEALSYREMLAAYRHALGLAPPLWLPLPMALMRLSARAAELVPQRVFSRDTLAMLERGSVPAAKASADSAALLGRTPSTLATGLAISRPEPALDLRVALSPAVVWTLRATLAIAAACLALDVPVALVAALPLLAVALLLWLARPPATAPRATGSAASPRRHPSPPAARRAA